ncbi:uncharacterized protein NPIL_35151 [Nephila pilipes]|uniref:Neurotransmitter-gated ion-channel ligand-binding domain-containing protein n=1 Tax=Nephila pilipes TaxID=299642 RepID=A0A8X6NFT5_NEPPI|nr:uncharacterized protein NPIL_35151 [Nephila pilipes]
MQIFWIDDRLLFNGVKIEDTECLNHIWNPGVIYRNVEEEHTMDTSLNYVLFYNNVKVLHERRFSFTVNCRMYFHDYPFDTQYCEFPMFVLDPINKPLPITWREYRIAILNKVELLQFSIRPPNLVQRESKKITINILALGNYTNEGAQPSKYNVQAK